MTKSSRRRDARGRFIPHIDDEERQARYAQDARNILVAITFALLVFLICTHCCMTQPPDVLLYPMPGPQDPALFRF